MKQLLIAAGLQWLRYVRGCDVVMFERGPRSFGHRPDLLAIGRDRHLIEIEIKLSVADFLAECKKNRTPVRELWYLVPRDIVTRIGTDCGLLAPGNARAISGIPDLVEIRRAIPNPAAYPISPEVELECIRGLSGSLVTLAGKFARASLEHKPVEEAALG